MIERPKNNKEKNINSKTGLIVIGTATLILMVAVFVFTIRNV